ncbi:hypothetical protein, partial [uncultured Nostoc sp.]
IIHLLQMLKRFLYMEERLLQSIKHLQQLIIHLLQMLKRFLYMEERLQQMLKFWQLMFKFERCRKRLSTKKQCRDLVLRLFRLMHYDKINLTGRGNPHLQGIPKMGIVSG